MFISFLINGCLCFFLIFEWEEWCKAGNYHYELKEHEEAIKAYDKAIELNPKYASA